MSKIIENSKNDTGNKKTRIAVFISGSGSNLQSIIDNIENGNLNCEISYVIADRECFGLERAEKHGIKSIMLDKKLFGNKLSNEISAILENDIEKTDYIVLAGYLSILSESPTTSKTSFAIFVASSKEDFLTNFSVLTILFLTVICGNKLND